MEVYKAGASLANEFGMACMFEPRGKYGITEDGDSLTAAWEEGKCNALMYWSDKSAYYFEAGLIDLEVAAPMFERIHYLAGRTVSEMIASD